MPDIPEDEVTMTDLFTWYTMSGELKKLKAKESLLRKRVFGHYFPAPAEGTNSLDLPDNYVLKGTYPITRNVDEGAFTALKEDFRAKGINPDLLVNWKPSLAKAAYNKLTAEEKQLFDQVLIIKPGSASMEVVLPKKAK